MTPQAIALLLQIGARLIPIVADATSRGDDSWKDIRLGDLIIEEDYKAVKERVKREMDR